MRHGGRSEVARLRRVLLKHPRDAFLDGGETAESWRDLSWVRAPDLEKAVEEHDAFRGLLESLGVRTELLPPHPDTGTDSIYCRDPSIVTDRGVILCRMGKEARAGEPEAHGAAHRNLGIPVLGEITGSGRLEGGDFVWLDRATAAVGRSYRTNDEGIRQLECLLGDEVELVPVPLPHWKGPSHVFHLMSAFSPLADDLALVRSPLLPVPFRELLLSRGTELVEVAEEELDSLGGNVLAVAPRVGVMLQGNPVTRSRLEAAGVRVHVYRGEEISVPGSGGPTCLTRPLLRRTE